jgi:hypothetical protein
MVLSHARKMEADYCIEVLNEKDYFLLENVDFWVVFGRKC